MSHSFPAYVKHLRQGSRLFLMPIHLTLISLEIPSSSPVFHFDANPDPDLTPSFTNVEKIRIKFFTFIHSSASLVEMDMDPEPDRQALEAD
jgi:hypothetical protein